MVVGGIIPDADVAFLREAGVAGVYTPKDFDITRIMRDIIALVGAAAEQTPVAVGSSSANGTA